MSLRTRTPLHLLGALTALGLAVWPSIALAVKRPQWHPGGPFSPITTPASDETRSISNLFWAVLGLSGAIFTFVCILLIVAVVKYSAKQDAPEPKQRFGDRNVELLWTLIPTFILIIAFFITVRSIRDINTAHAGNVLNVYVTGHQWWWEFHYPSGQYGVGQQDIYTADEVHIPTGITVHFHVGSADVIHSFWTPEIHRQLDANPGQDNAIIVPPLTRTGVFDGACYEYCGDAHAWMKFKMVVQTPTDFRAWAKHQSEASIIPTSGLAAAGYKVFISSTCVQCHNVEGTPAGAQVGPNLTHVGSRWTIGAGALPMSQADLARWVSAPDTYKPGVLMPGYPQFSHKDLTALAAYLISLK
jgi:cytochrome c oxidase subunit II